MSKELSFLDSIKVQMELLLPILNLLRDKYGKKEIDKLVFEEIDRVIKSKLVEKADQLEGNDKDKFQALTSEIVNSVEGDVELEFVDMTDQRIELYANSCKIADYFKSLNESELGYHLACKVDDHVAEIFGKSVEFKRENTLMMDGVKCDYLYNLSEQTSQA